MDELPSWRKRYRKMKALARLSMPQLKDANLRRRFFHFVRHALAEAARKGMAHLIKSVVAHPTNIPSLPSMKTKLFLLLVLSSGAFSLQAGKPVAKAPALTMPRNIAVRPAAPLSFQAPAKAPSFQIPQPATLKPGISTVTRGTPPVRGFTPAAAGHLNPGTSPSFSNNPRLNGFTGSNGAAMRAGFDIANSLNGLDQVRRALPDGVRQSLGVNPGQPSQDAGIDLSLSGSQDGPREMKNPFYSPSNRGTGLTDIRSASGKSRQATGHGDRPMSSFGRDLSRQGTRTGGITYGSIGNDRVSYSQTNSTIHNTTEHRDSQGRTTGYTDSHADYGDNRDTTDHYDRNGNFKGSETHTTRSDGSSQCKDVAADGSVVVTEKDSSGHVTTSQACGRTPDDVSMGGPINGTGPSVADVAGLKSIDLVRQFANGEPSSGGTNWMTSGSLGGRHIRPENPDSTTSNGGATRNRIPQIRYGTIVNPGTVDTLGGGRPE